MRKYPKPKYYTYNFFLAWTVLGLLLSSQIVPADMTVSETWFYFTMVGLLGMIGSIIDAKVIRLKADLVIAISILLITSLGVRTALRGTDWVNQFKLASTDIVASPENFSAYISLSSNSYSQGDYRQAQRYAQKSISIYPSFSGFYNLGSSYVRTENYAGAYDAYYQGLKYQNGNKSSTYETLGQLALLLPNAADRINIVKNGLKAYPDNSMLWLYLALLQDRSGNNEAAINAIENAKTTGTVPDVIYTSIIKQQSYYIYLQDVNKTVYIRR